MLLHCRTLLQECFSRVFFINFRMCREIKWQHWEPCFIKNLHNFLEHNCISFCCQVQAVAVNTSITIRTWVQRQSIVLTLNLILTTNTTFVQILDFNHVPTERSFRPAPTTIITSEAQGVAKKGIFSKFEGTICKPPRGLFKLPNTTS